MINRTGYEPLRQSAEDDLEEGDVGLHQSQPQSPRKLRRPQIDLRTIDTAFKKWTENIAQKKTESALRKIPIMHSVFGPEIVPPTNYSPPIKTLDHNIPVSHEEYVAIAEAVREAISEGVHPKMISKGSSGSYFARAKRDGKVQTIGVFKPKDEEPYGRLNPKTTKWIHRQLRWIIPFGRSCLIPNLSYISEAAASLLDTRLQLYIVPRTELVTFSSPAFFYDWLDRNATKKGKPLPGKIGSMQMFMHGYQGFLIRPVQISLMCADLIIIITRLDASEFLRTHPLPGRSISDTFDDSSHRTGGTTKRFLSAFQIICGRTGAEDLNEEDDDEEGMYIRQPSQDGFHWTKLLQQEFKEELEKYMTKNFLDFLMRNTDRGADNYMIKYCEGSHERPLIDIAPSRSSMSVMPVMREITSPDPRTTSSSSLPKPPFSIANEITPQYAPKAPHIHIAAIDNSLAFPHEHPKGWRSFTYGWLYLPVSVIGRPFSTQTREHFLPLLTSKVWWEETTYELRKLFALDPDFHPKMFKRQLAVMKGQAWNIVQCLKHSDEGPLELTRRQKVLIWDDEVEIPEDDYLSSTLSTSTPTSAHPSQSSRPRAYERRIRSRSMEGYPFPPPMRRLATDSVAGPGTRPVPFAGKFQQINPGASGVRVLEHMERLDEVEKGLKKLGMEEVLEEEEEDVGVIHNEEHSPEQPVQEDVAAAKVDFLDNTSETEDHNEALASSIISAPPLTNHLSDTEADISNNRHEHQRPVFHGRGASERVRRSLDWVRSPIVESPIGGKKRTVIVERLEVINPKPFLSCW
ncbi:hypothetical protein Clacol_000250 [Clathrus columnatus]|uniref:Phosphatidylinositol 4-kinase n=1 Tax=Clathrus columnatus TaxID=1419009 RepID=A0AAV4ZWE7_9AGAM|nr:hypothetical protein Clacol_000250 [Clathrus columnatus]